MNLRDKCSAEKKSFARHLRKNMTPAEERLWEALKRKSLGFRFKPQRVIRGFIVDFYCPEVWLIVEVDGSSHTGRELKDAARDRIMADLGFVTIRFSNDEVLTDLPTVIFEIGFAINRQLAKGVKPLRGDVPQGKLNAWIANKFACL